VRSQSQPVTLEQLGIALDRDAEVPLGVQLAWALRARVHDGRLEPGVRLPALRDLAEGLGVNSNTIRTVYQRLEQEGLLCSMQGSGTFVAALPSRRSAVGAIAQAAAQEARATGVDPREVAAALYVAAEPARRERTRTELEGGVPVRGSAANDPAERRRQLRARITVLEQGLAELEVQHPRLARAARAGEPRSSSGPRLLDSDELEQVQAGLLRRIAAIQMAIDGQRDGAASTRQTPARQVRGAGAAKPAAAKRKRPRATPRPATTGP
jgi:DNA-binding transcriptional regulator YhcF (GntR family)